MARRVTSSTGAPADRGKRGENTDKRDGDPHHPDGEHQ